MLRTTLLTLVLVLLGGWSGAWITRDFQVWTAEGARRLTVIEQPVDTPLATLTGPGVAGSDLRARLSGPGRATIVDFVYTRCPTVCLSLGSGFQQLQQALAKTPDSGVQLMSISFDPLHDDAASLQRYAAQWRADPRHWTIATVPDAVQLQRLLDAFQVVVIDDGRGGFEHNAALLVIDGRGRLVRIFDDTDTELALNHARALSARQARQ
jgi:protein SCO1/2